MPLSWLCRRSAAVPEPSGVWIPSLCQLCLRKTQRCTCRPLLKKPFGCTLSQMSLPKSCVFCKAYHNIAWTKSIDIHLDAPTLLQVRIKHPQRMWNLAWFTWSDQIQREKGKKKWAHHPHTSHVSHLSLLSPHFQSKTTATAKSSTLPQSAADSHRCPSCPWSQSQGRRNCLKIHKMYIYLRERMAYTIVMIYNQILYDLRGWRKASKVCTSFAHFFTQIDVVIFCKLM